MTIITLNKTIIRITIFQVTGTTITVTFQVTELITLTAIDSITTVIIIFRETEIMIIDKKI